MMENMVLNMANSNSVKENKTYVFVNNNTSVTNTTTISSSTTVPTSTTVGGGTVKSKSGGGSLKRSRAAADSSGTPPELMRCKRRINFAQLGYSLPQAPPSSVARRNERERNRVKLVNLGFATLREHVPNGSKNKKMSKVETLRSAVEYIRKLQELLDDTDGALQDLFAVDSASSAGSPSQQSSENMMPMSNETTAVSTNSLPGLCYHQNRNGVSTGVSTGAGAGGGNTGSGGGGGIVHCPPSSVSPVCSAASSPTPSYTSDCSYEPLSPEEEELLDFTSWFT